MWLTAIAGGTMAVAMYFLGMYMVKRGHRHDWTPWSRVWSEEEQKLTMVQERVCKTCAFYEANDPTPVKECPPHKWGKWEDGGEGTFNDGGQTRSCMLQAHFCTKCGVKSIQRITNRENE